MLEPDHGREDPDEDRRRPEEERHVVAAEVLSDRVDEADLVEEDERAASSDEPQVAQGDPEAVARAAYVKIQKSDVAQK